MGIVEDIGIELLDVKFLIDSRPTIAKAFAKDVFINEEWRLGDWKQSDTARYWPNQDEDQWEDYNKQDIN